MEQFAISNQTLQEFIKEPFGMKNDNKHLQYEDRYQKYKKSNRIRVEATLVFEDNYFIHLKVPSESQKGLSYYDVVIQFFTPLDVCKRQVHLNNYYVQFFSNSPGFVYKYATLYRMQGYLIETLVDKFTPGALDILPEKSNKNFELSYDSSIYYASRYILDNKLRILGKLNFRIFKHKTVQNFFGGIQDFETSEIGRSVAGLENKLKDELKRDTKLNEQQETKLRKHDFFRREILHKRNSQRKEASKSTFKDKSKESRIVASTKSNNTKTSVRVTPKKRASNTTIKPR